VSVSVVLVDNGEKTLKQTIASLRSQTLKPSEIIVAAGPRTSLDLAKKYADKVLEPTEGIGKARVEGVLAANGEYIISADSDTLYNRRYVQFAVQDLDAGAKAVRAGVILPLEFNHPLILLETALSLIPNYEFALAFRKEAFIEAGIHKEDYSNPRMDIGGHVARRLGVTPDFRIICYTRMPTKGAYEYSEKYLASAIAGAAPLVAVTGVTVANEMFKLLLSPRRRMPSYI